MYLLDVSIRDLKYFCVLFVLFVFLFMLLALLRCYTSIFDGFIFEMVVNDDRQVGGVGCLGRTCQATRGESTNVPLFKISS